MAAIMDSIKGMASTFLGYAKSTGADADTHSKLDCFAASLLVDFRKGQKGERFRLHDERVRLSNGIRRTVRLSDTRRDR